MQRQYLPGETSNRLDQINRDCSLESIHRHGDFSIAPTAVARQARWPNDQLPELTFLPSNLNASSAWADVMAGSTKRRSRCFEHKSSTQLHRSPRRRLHAEPPTMECDWPVT